MFYIKIRVRLPASLALFNQKVNLVGNGVSENSRGVVLPKNAILVEDIKRMLICDSLYLRKSF